MNITIEIKPGTVKRLLAIAGGLALIAGVVTVANAVPVSFSDGNVLTAAQLNANFTDLETRVAALEDSHEMVQSGSVVGSFNDGVWDLHVANGMGRDAAYHVTFDPPFAAPPQIALSLNYVDAGGNVGIRIGVSALNVTENGFDLNFGTYYDGVIDAAAATWIARGQ